MRAGLVMFARPVMAAVTLPVFVMVAFIQWGGTMGMPSFPIALASSEKMCRARKMLADLQPSPASGRDDERYKYSQDHLHEETCCYRLQYSCQER